MKVVYIAGKITGDPEYKYRFRAAKELLKPKCIVLNPAELPEGMPKERYMPICLSMVGQADILCLLPGWMDSTGAMIEKDCAGYQGIMVCELAELLEDLGIM